MAGGTKDCCFGESLDWSVVLGIRRRPRFGSPFQINNILFLGADEAIARESSGAGAERRVGLGACGAGGDGDGVGSAGGAREALVEAA